MVFLVQFVDLKESEDVVIQRIKSQKKQHETNVEKTEHLEFLRTILLGENTMSEESKNELSVLNRYKAKLIKWGIIAVMLIIAILAIFFKGRSSATEKYEDIVAELKQQVTDLKQQLEEAPSTWDDSPTKEITLDLIESEIKDIGELATIEYLYTDAGKFEDAKQLFGLNVPFTTKSFIAKWDGIIKAGVKIDRIIVEINDTNKEIIIHMPNAEILSHEIDNDSIETLDEKDGLFNKITVGDTREFDAVSKEAMEERATENGILDKAFKNAKEIIEKLINNDVVQEQEYTIKFEVIK